MVLTKEECQMSHAFSEQEENRMVKPISTDRVPRANTVVIVNDGAERWVGNKREIYNWLSARGHQRSYDTSRNLPNTVKLDADTYQSMCDGVSYRGRYDHLTHEQISALEDRGAETLHVA